MCLRGPNIQALSTQATFFGFFETAFLASAGGFLVKSAFLMNFLAAHYLKKVQKISAGCSQEAAGAAVEG
ncbi:MAG: hypothetical protein WKG07_30525 [Hymenobacter sp.]